MSGPALDYSRETRRDKVNAWTARMRAHMSNHPGSTVAAVVLATVATIALIVLFGGALPNVPRFIRAIALPVVWVILFDVIYVALLPVGWLFERLIENNYKALLIGRYLVMRRIAWVSLVAVMLCTTMVVVVRSVMGGWLDMFKEQFHG